MPFTVLAALIAAPAAASAGQVRAGAAAVDASWHVGASAGQYASDGTPVDPANGTYNPTAESIRRAPSYGIQSRLQVRAIVVEGPDGTRTAIVKNDNYIPQDLLYRRAAQLMEERGDCGIDAEHLTMAVTHDHSSPYYSSTSWGVWAFQDVFDVRFFNYLAERMYLAVERACDELVPVRVGASVGSFDKTHRHSFGPAIADDGTPAGYPDSNTDHDLTVIRFDDISNPAHPKPLANVLNFSLHPEFLEGNDLISADYVAPLQRMTDRATGAVNIWTQGAVGTSEPERSTYHSIHERLEFTHRDYAQAEYGARLMSDEVIRLWRGIRRGDSGDAGRYVPFMTDFPVHVEDRWYPGPFSHPYPGVSNCRTDKGLTGDPQLPVVGLPTCQGVQSGLEALADELGLPPPPDAGLPAIDPGLTTDDFQAAGIPVPENYGAPAYTGLEEDIDVHLQVIRLGGILLTVCSCEQWYDQSQNIETRTDRVAGNEHLGYDWGAQCTPVGGGGWSCPDPTNPGAKLPPVTDLEYRRMRAQVNNPANGWNDAENAATAESEPADPAEIKGNYAHDDRCGPTPLTPGDDPCAAGGTPVSAQLGYRLTVPISMANDYNGYIATYREYQRGDHYRKALTGWGPHSSDYMATRLVTMARQLKQPGLVLPRDQRQEAALAAKAALDTRVNDARARALGEAGSQAIAAYEGALPDDRPPAPLEEPKDVERFGAAFFTWNGGSNFTDNPAVRVQRRLPDGSWRPYADGSGELPVTLKFPQGEDVPSYLSGDQEWRWTAHFEAFVSRFDTGERPIATPAATYRFVVDGSSRRGGEPRPYHLISDTFEVRPWSGITVADLRLERDGTMSFRVGPRTTHRVTGDGGPDLEATIGPIDYPDSYESPIPFIREERTAIRDPGRPADPGALEWFCFTCSFRPWVDAGDAWSARVTVVDWRSGTARTFAATASEGRWRTARRLRPGEVAFVEAGGVRDPWGNRNGALAGPLMLPRAGGAGGVRHCQELIRGTSARDRLVGTTADELIAGFGGADVLRGGDGDDCLLGGPGRDRMNGGRGGDRIRDGAGDDVARGRGGVDRMRGGAGSDRIVGGASGDYLHTVGHGRDVVRCGAGRDVAKVGVVDDVRGCERLHRGP